MELFEASVPYRCEMPRRVARAFDNTCKAIDMMEMFERVSIRNHKSFLPHGAIYKISRDILTLGDVWALDDSDLELQDAATKRTATSSGSRCLEMRSSGVMRAPLHSEEDRKLRLEKELIAGPEGLISTRGYSTSFALSTLRSMLALAMLRRGDGILSIPSSRQTTRLFAHGRLTLNSAGCSNEKLALAETYDPREDTCVAAFVRFLAAIAATAANQP